MLAITTRYRTKEGLENLKFLSPDKRGFSGKAKFRQLKLNLVRVGDNCNYDLNNIPLQFSGQARGKASYLKF